MSTPPDESENLQPEPDLRTRPMGLQKRLGRWLWITIAFIFIVLLIIVFTFREAIM